MIMAAPRLVDAVASLLLDWSVRLRGANPNYAPRTPHHVPPDPDSHPPPFPPSESPKRGHTEPTQRGGDGNNRPQAARPPTRRGPDGERDTRRRARRRPDHRGHGVA